MALWKKYSFGIVLLVLFVAAWAIMTWTDWVYFAAEQAQHHSPADVFGSSGYVWRWGLDTFSNWQADFLGQGLGVILGAYLIFRGSEQSKDSSDDLQSVVEDVERQVLGSQEAKHAERQTQARAERGGPLRNYGLGIALIGAFVISWILMTWMGWMEFASTSKEHGQTAEVFGTSGYIWEWMRETVMNWQADFLGHAMLVIVPAYLLYKQSSQSRGGMDQVQDAMWRVQTALRNQQQQGSATPPGTYVETLRRRRENRPAGFMKKYGLGIALLAVFLVSWILQTWTGWGYYVSDQLQHHSTAEVFGASGYIWQWGQDTFSNWQSDLLWAGLIVLMGAYYVYQGSAESKDSDDRIEELAFSIESQVRGEEPAQRDQQASTRHVFDDVWHNRGLAWALIAAGVISWALMTWTGWMYFSATQQEHGSAAQLLGSSGYIWDWFRLTLENWQSDILGNAAVIVLSAYLLYQGSGMSRESDDEIEASLQRIQKALQQQDRQQQAETPQAQSTPSRS